MPPRCTCSLLLPPPLSPRACSPLWCSPLPRLLVFHQTDRQREIELLSYKSVSTRKKETKEVGERRTVYRRRTRQHIETSHQPTERAIQSSSAANSHIGCRINQCTRHRLRSRPRAAFLSLPVPTRACVRAQCGQANWLFVSPNPQVGGTPGSPPSPTRAPSPHTTRRRELAEQFSFLSCVSCGALSLHVHAGSPGSLLTAVVSNLSPSAAELPLPVVAHLFSVCRLCRWTRAAVAAAVPHLVSSAFFLKFCVLILFRISTPLLRFG